MIRARQGTNHGTGGTLMKATDPVCGMKVDPENAADQVEHEGRTYYFCSEGCRKAFQDNPKEYVE